MGTPLLLLFLFSAFWSFSLLNHTSAACRDSRNVAADRRRADHLRFAGGESLSISVPEQSYQQLAGPPALNDSSDFDGSPLHHGTRRNGGVPFGGATAAAGAAGGDSSRLGRWRLFGDAEYASSPAGPSSAAGGALHIGGVPEEPHLAEYLRITLFLFILVVGYLFNRGISVWLHLPKDGHRSWRAVDMACASSAGPPP